MKKYILLFVIVMMSLILVGCSNMSSKGRLPKEKKELYAFEDFRWSPDGKKAAVYLDESMHIITPDGKKVKDSVRMEIDQFKKYKWIKERGEWEYVSKTSEIGMETDTNNDIPGEDKHGDKQGTKNDSSSNYDILSDYYEEVQLDENNRIYLSHSVKYFEVTKVDNQRKAFITIFKSNHILFGLNYNDDRIYFVGLNPKDNLNRYTLYRVSDDAVEEIFLH